MNRQQLKFIIDAVCKITTDQTTLDIAQAATMKSGGRAEKFLQHYLEGSEKDLKVDIQKLLREDRGVRKTIENFITSTINKPFTPAPSSKIPLPQYVFKSSDWKYATGSINMRWKMIPATMIDKRIAVQLSFKNQYRWHPNENRITKCVHQAAENLKINGAKDYWIIGGPIIYSFYPDKRFNTEFNFAQ